MSPAAKAAAEAATKRPSDDRRERILEVAIDEFAQLHAELELERARKVMANLSNPAPAPPVQAQAPRREERGGLTVRELEVLKLVSIGLSNHAIAERLFISEHTVHRHVANILTKLTQSSRAAAAAQATRLGYI